ncbi:MAG: flavodoxin domain-containing protein [Candidatus Marinimicrobia bacterium]|nr:flavodoxin domain-containing protein [Candidatus Neomarinimicrobiota bacterium]
MKTLIVYASKYGGTGDIAKVLKSKINEDVDLINLKSKSEINLNDYTTVLIGTSIYRGKARQTVINFCAENLDKLLEKNTGIFISCWFDDKIEEYIQSSFPDKLIENSKIVYAGILADPSEMSFLDRVIVKTVAKMKKSVSHIKENNLEQLAAITQNNNIE